MSVLTAQDWHVVILDEAQTHQEPERRDHAPALSGCEAGIGCACPARRWRTTWASCGRCSTSSPRASSATPQLRAPVTARRSRSMATASAQAALNQRVRPFLLRRTKDEVVRRAAAEDRDRRAAWRWRQASARSTMRSGVSMHAKVRGRDRRTGAGASGIIILLDALLKMRQACCDPRLLKLKPRGAEGRLGQAGAADGDA